MNDKNLPIVLVDQDDVLVDLAMYIFQLWKEDGIEVDIDSQEQQKHRFLTGHLANPSDFDRARKHVNEGDIFRQAPPVPGALEGINKLAHYARVWICTKPLEDNIRCRDDKAWWIRKYLGKEWEKRLILAPDKSMVRGHVLLDDAPPKIGECMNQWTPVLFTRPWNDIHSEWAALKHWNWSMHPEWLLSGGVAR